MFGYLNSAHRALIEKSGIRQDIIQNFAQHSRIILVESHCRLLPPPAGEAFCRYCCCSTSTIWMMLAEAADIAHDEARTYRPRRGPRISRSRWATPKPASHR